MSNISIKAGSIKAGRDVVLKPTLPPFDDDVKWILGRPNFTLINIARALRISGQEIPNKAEDEQAHSIYWMLEMYVMHGKNWRKACNGFLEQALQK